MVEYSVVELNVEAAYTVTVTTNEGNFTITNSYTPETINIEGVKTWDDADNEDDTRPESIIVNLHVGESVVDSLEVTADESGNWSYTFTDLPRFEDGVEINYTVTETPVEGYEAVVDGFDITNTLIPTGDDTPEPTPEPGAPEDPKDPEKPEEDESLPQTGLNNPFS